VKITNNVITDIGLSRPTNRTLGWCLDINDWDIGLVSGNLFMHETSPEVGNVYAINLDGQTRNVEIKDNVVHGLGTNGDLVILSDGTDKENVSFTNNQLQNPDYETGLIRAKGSLANYSFSNNTYTSKKTATEWFRLSDGSRTDLAGWITASGETGAANNKLSYSDPNRSLESYHASLGKTATITAFITEARKQSKFNWRKEYTAAVINDWMRAGFGMPAGIAFSGAHPDLVFTHGIELYPNPFSSCIEIRLPGRDAQVKVFNVNGELITSLPAAGKNTVYWDAADSAEGIYLVRVITGDQVFQEKVFLVK
jgi:hypothetical protein